MVMRLWQNIEKNVKNGHSKRIFIKTVHFQADHVFAESYGDELESTIEAYNKHPLVPETSIALNGNDMSFVGNDVLTPMQVKSLLQYFHELQTYADYWAFLPAKTLYTNGTLQKFSQPSNPLSGPKKWLIKFFKKVKELHIFVEYRSLLYFFRSLDHIILRLFVAGLKLDGTSQLFQIWHTFS